MARQLARHLRSFAALLLLLARPGTALASPALTMMPLEDLLKRVFGMLF